MMNHPSMACCMPKPLGVTGLWTGERQWTQAPQPLGGWASPLLPSPPCFPCDCFLFNPDSCLPSLSVVTGGCSTALEHSACRSFCEVPGPHDLWGLHDITLWTPRLMRGAYHCCALSHRPASSWARLYAWSSHALEYCFLLSAWVGAQFPYSC